MDKQFKQLEFELKKDIHSIIRNEQQKINDFIKKMKLAEYNREWKKIESFHVLSTKIPIRNSSKIKKPKLIKYNIRNNILEYKTFPNEKISYVIVPFKLSKDEYDSVKREIESKICYYK